MTIKTDSNDLVVTKAGEWKVDKTKTGEKGNVMTGADYLESTKKADMDEVKKGYKFKNAKQGVNYKTSTLPLKSA